MENEVSFKIASKQMFVRLPQLWLLLLFHANRLELLQRNSSELVASRIPVVECNNRCTHNSIANEIYIVIAMDASDDYQPALLDGNAVRRR
jgi:hypothetical protein